MRSEGGEFGGDVPGASDERSAYARLSHRSRLGNGCVGDRDVTDNSPYITRAVTVSGLVVAVGVDEYFISADAAAAPWSGVLVQGPPPADRGSRVAVAGTAVEYAGETRITGVVASKVYGDDPREIAPLRAKTGWLDCEARGVEGRDDRAPNAPESLEGVLIRLEGVSLKSDADPLTGQVLIDDGSGVARLDDRLLDTDRELQLRWDTLGLKGRRLKAIVGVVTYAYGNFQISPRDAGDLEYDAPPDSGTHRGASGARGLARALVLVLVLAALFVGGGIAAGMGYYRWALARRPHHARVVGQTLGGFWHAASLALCCCFGAAPATADDAGLGDSVTTEYDFAPRAERELV